MNNKYDIANFSKSIEEYSNDEEMIRIAKHLNITI